MPPSKKWARWVLGISFLLGFVTRLWQPGTLISRVNVLDLAVGLAVAYWLFFKSVRQPFWLLAFLSIAALSFGWGVVSYGWATESFLYLVRLAAFLLFAGSLSQLPGKGRQWPWLAWLGGGIALLGAVQLAVWPAIPVSISLSHGFDPHNGRLFALWFDPNITAVLLSLTTLGTVAAMKDKIDWRQPWLWLLLLQGWALLATQSRSGLLSLGLMLAIYAWQRAPRWLLLVLAGAIMLPFASPSLAARLQGLLSVDDTATARLVSWRSGWGIIEDSPVLGVGYNYYRQAALRDGSLHLRYGQVNLAANGSDSTLLTVWATTGLAGLFCFVMMLVALCRQGSHPARVAALGGMLVNSLFINSLLLGPVWFLLALVWRRD